MNNDLGNLLLIEPSKVRTEENRKDAASYYMDIENNVIHVGDTVEIKSVTGGYGRTDIFKGLLLEIDCFGRFRLEIEGEKKYIGVSSDLNFDLLTETATSTIMVFNTVTKHGFGAMDVHAHDTYVKITKKKLGQ